MFLLLLALSNEEKLFNTSAGLPERYILILYTLPPSNCQQNSNLEAEDEAEAAAAAALMVNNAQIDYLNQYSA